MKHVSSFRSISGNVCAPLGFLSAGVSAGIKSSGGTDLALVVSKTPCEAAGSFTTNLAKAAPVLYDLSQIRRGTFRGIVANSGNANAGTGESGLRDVQRTAEIVSAALRLCFQEKHSNRFLVCSTGRIGIPLPMDRIERGIQRAVQKLSRNDRLVAQAIMTTDTFAKKAAIEFSIHHRMVRLGGIAKGAGMISPKMSHSGNISASHATMLCFLTTDLAIERRALQTCLNEAVERSFNRITVDGDMSTNDTILILANGQAGNPVLRRFSSELKRFQSALNHLTHVLAQMIIQDGEGISKVVSIEVTGAASTRDAEKAVRSIGTSTLVKCSWYGEDPNWGRIYAAVGYSGANLVSSKFSLKYNGIHLVYNGLEIKRNLQRICAILCRPSFHIQCDLGLGNYRALLYTTDLTEKYIQLNKGE